MKIRKLTDLNLTPRPDLEQEQTIKDVAPPAVGQYSSLQQYEGTNLVQWYISKAYPHWTPYGDVFVIGDLKRD